MNLSFPWGNARRDLTIQLFLSSVALENNLIDPHEKKLSTACPSQGTPLQSSEMTIAYTNNAACILVVAGLQMKKVSALLWSGD